MLYSFPKETLFFSLIQSGDYQSGSIIPELNQVLHA